MILKKISCLILLTSLLSANTSILAVSKPYFNHVLIVIFENMSVSDVMKGTAFAKLSFCAANPNAYGCQPSSTSNYGYASFKNYYNNHSGGKEPTRPSQPNYIAMTSGSTQNIHDNSNYDLDVDNITMELKDAKQSWKAYAENLPSESCPIGDSTDKLYVRKHLPFISYTNVQKCQCSNIVNAETLKDDLVKKLPNVSFYIPNLTNDGHNDNQGTGENTAERIRNANTFLAQMMGMDLATGNYLASAPSGALFQKFMDKGGLVVLTFDEPSLSSNDKSMFTLLAGKMIKSGEYSPVCYPDPASANNQTKASALPYDAHMCNHYNLLKLLENNWSLRGLDKKNTSKAYQQANTLDKDIALYKSYKIDK